MRLAYRLAYRLRNDAEALRQRNDAEYKIAPRDDRDELIALRGSLLGSYLSPEGRLNTLARIKHLEEEIARCTG